VLEQLGRLRERVEARRLRDQPGVFRDQRRQLLQVPGAGPPPAPVRGQHLAEPACVDRVAAVAPVAPGTGLRCAGLCCAGLRRADRHPGEQVRDVVRVLGVQLEDLQLGQQQVGRVERERRIAERRPEIERVAHRQPVHHDVDGPS
jgi:hypothetical protein